MNASDLKKDKVSSVRINSDILKIIKKKGLSIQSILDEAIDKIAKVKIDKKK